MEGQLNTHSKYAYAANDPITKFDANGMFVFSNGPDSQTTVDELNNDTVYTPNITIYREPGIGQWCYSGTPTTPLEIMLAEAMDDDEAGVAHRLGLVD